MVSKTAKPPGLASRSGSELHCLAASAVRQDSAPAPIFQAEANARDAVAEMIGRGARFEITRQPGRETSFLWSLHGDDRDRDKCRAIIADAKAQNAVYWQASSQRSANTPEGRRDDGCARISG